MTTLGYAAGPINQPLRVAAVVKCDDRVWATAARGGRGHRKKKNVARRAGFLHLAPVVLFGTICLYLFFAISHMILSQAIHELEKLDQQFDMALDDDQLVMADMYRERMIDTRDRAFDEINEEFDANGLDIAAVKRAELTSDERIYRIQREPDGEKR